MFTSSYAPRVKERCGKRLKSTLNFSFQFENNFLGVNYLARAIEPYFKIVTNLPWTLKKLHGKILIIT